MRLAVLVLLLVAGTSEGATVRLKKNVKTVTYTTDDKLKVFCYNGAAERPWTRIWSCLEFVVISKAEEFHLDVGENATTLTERYGNSWSWSSLTDFAGITKQATNYQKKTTIAPYDDTCIGVSYHGSSNTKYSVELRETVISYQFPLLLVIGVVLLLTSYRISRSVSFHYTSAAVIGIVASVLVLVYLVSKLVPGRPMAASVLVGGWAMVAWVFSEIKSNLFYVITLYPHYVIIYVVVVGVTSLLFCHWRGPISQQRTFQTMQWSIQLLGVALIYNATQLREASVILLAMVITLFLVRNKLSYCFHGVYHRFVVLPWYRLFPPKRKMLTSTEYKEEGERETTVALQKLREYCLQNSNKTWSYLTKIHSPNRFSKFLDGDFHLTDTEVQDYHRSTHYSDCEDDMP